MFLTSTEVAKRTGLSFNQVQELIAAKKIPYNQRPTGEIVHWDADITTAFSKEPLKSMERLPETENNLSEGSDDAFEEEKSPEMASDEPETPEVKAKRHYKRRKRAKISA